MQYRLSAITRNLPSVHSSIPRRHITSGTLRTRLSEFCSAIACSHRHHNVSNQIEEAITAVAHTDPAAGICAVIVTFNPDLSSLLQVLRAIHGAVEHVVVVDNASRRLEERCVRDVNPDLLLERLPANVGIAAAQNKGIDIARRRSAKYV